MSYPIKIETPSPLGSQSPTVQVRRGSHALLPIQPLTPPDLSSPIPSDANIVYSPCSVTPQASFFRRIRDLFSHVNLCEWANTEITTRSSEQSAIADARTAKKGSAGEKNLDQGQNPQAVSAPQPHPTKVLHEWTLFPPPDISQSFLGPQTSHGQ